MHSHRSTAAAATGVSGIRLIDGYVSDDDLEVQMTPGDDVVDLVVGESEYTVTVGAGTAAQPVR